MSNAHNCDLDNNTNGLILNSTFLPVELIAKILVFVDWEDLLSCRKVCKTWYRLIDYFVKTEKLKSCPQTSLKLSFVHPANTFSDIPFYLCYAIAHGSFGRNLLKNPFGSGEIPHECQREGRSIRGIRLKPIIACSDDDCPRFKDWLVTESNGDGWSVEPTPVGCQPLPEHLEGKSCFVTSYYECAKQQLIRLQEFGLNSKIMDEIQPHFKISEWYARRFDCRSEYTLNVFLLGGREEDLQIIDTFEKTDNNMVDDDWIQVTHTFKDYGPKVRYILFQHSGKDCQFWAGHYGSKMAGGSVIAELPMSNRD